MWTPRLREQQTNNANLVEDKTQTEIEEAITNEKETEVQQWEKKWKWEARSKPTTQMKDGSIKLSRKRRSSKQKKKERYSKEWIIDKKESR